MQPWDMPTYGEIALAVIATCSIIAVLPQGAWVLRRLRKGKWKGGG